MIKYVMISGLLCFPYPIYMYMNCSKSVELRSWSGYCALITQLDKYRFFFHTSNVTLRLSSKDSNGLY